jgi:hypothetical protein
MSGYRIPSAAAQEDIDPGTAARTRMPTPGPMVHRVSDAAAQQPVADAPMSGAVLVGTGVASVARIPIPGARGLAIEFSPRGRVPASGSTSTLFFQDLTGRRHLRLDYGFNVRANSVNYHWNQSGTHAQFGIADHAPAGRAGAVAHRAARYFRWAGRTVLVAAAVADAVSIVQADRPLRRATQVVAGWAAAWLGCKLVGAGAAAVGTLASPLGTAVGGVGGCIVGGAAAYWGGSVLAGEVSEWAEGTVFTPLPEAPAP